jgi:hypothetical protein
MQSRQKKGDNLETCFVIGIWPVIFQADQI